MRHYPDLRASSPRWARLFELQRQRDAQRLLDEAGDRAETLRPDIALRLRDRAVRSFRTVEPYD